MSSIGKYGREEVIEGKRIVIREDRKKNYGRMGTTNNSGKDKKEE